MEILILSWVGLITAILGISVIITSVIKVGIKEGHEAPFLLVVFVLVMLGVLSYNNVVYIY